MFVTIRNAGNLPRTDHTTRIPSGVASPFSTSHEANGCMFVNLRNAGNLIKFALGALELRAVEAPRLPLPERKSARERESV